MESERPIENMMQDAKEEAMTGTLRETSIDSMGPAQVEDAKSKEIVGYEGESVSA